jgi:hypothetical protein
MRRTSLTPYGHVKCKPRALHRTERLAKLVAATSHSGLAAASLRQPLSTHRWSACYLLAWEKQRG